MPRKPAPASRRAGALGIALVLLLSVVLAAPLAAEEDPLVAAIRAKDVAKVNSLIKQQVDVNAYRGQFPKQLPTTPLYEAVDAGSVEIVRALLDAGADVNRGRDDPEASFGVTGPVESATVPARLSPLGLAVLNANADIVSLLITRRAPVAAGHLLLAEDTAILRLLRAAATPAVLRRYATLRFSKPIMEGDAAGLRQAIRDPELAAALRGLGQDTDLLLAYSYAGAAFREVIRTSGPPEVASGSSNLLDRLLSQGVEIGEPSDSRPVRGLDRWLALPLATTFLRDEKAPLRYAEASAFDGDQATSWVEGVDGPGIHQKLAFALHTAIPSRRWRNGRSPSWRNARPGGRVRLSASPQRLLRLHPRRVVRVRAGGGKGFAPRFRHGYLWGRQPREWRKR